MFLISWVQSYGYQKLPKLFKDPDNSGLFKPIGARLVDNGGLRLSVRPDKNSGCNGLEF